MNAEKPNQIPAIINFRAGATLPIRVDNGDGGLYFSGDGPHPIAYSSCELVKSLRLETTALADGMEILSRIAAPAFFDLQEFRTTDAMTERIIPTDESSPGASAAGVCKFVDRFLAVSPGSVQTGWRVGLAAINRLCQTQFGADFHELDDSTQDDILREISRNESSPQTVEERFFSIIKRMTWDVYYRSEVGIHLELKYRGNSHEPEFLGCDHVGHQ